MEFATILSVAIAVYVLPPVLTVASLNTSDLHGPNGVKASITVMGTGIKTVTVQCQTNKVIFDDRFTLELNRYALVDEHSFPDVAAGESFTADCGFSWSMWVNGSDGFFVFGEFASGVKSLGIPFKINGDKLSPAASGATPMVAPSNMIGYRRYITSDVDASFIVHYKWPLCWLTEERIIHMIALRTDKELNWRVASRSEPVIPDSSGDKITVSGSPTDYAITMKSAGRKR